MYCIKIAIASGRNLERQKRPTTKKTKEWNLFSMNWLNDTLLTFHTTTTNSIVSQQLLNSWHAHSHLSHSWEHQLLMNSKQQHSKMSMNSNTHVHLF